MIDYAMLAAIGTAAIATIATYVSVRNWGRYQAALEVLQQSSMFVSAVSEVITEATEALADDQLTPEELKDIVARLEKVVAFLEELKKLLGK